MRERRTNTCETKRILTLQLFKALINYPFGNRMPMSKGEELWNKLLDV